LSKTFITTARCDIEDIATVANFLIVNNNRNLSRSRILSKGISMIAEIIRQNHPGMTFNLESAMEFLDAIGIEYKTTRSAGNLAKKLQISHLEQLAEDETLVETQPECLEDQPSRGPVFSKEEIAEANKRREAELKKQVAAFSKLPSSNIE
jgi:hypothetical protein